MAKQQTIFISLTAFLLLSTAGVSATVRRRVLHYPLFPLNSPPPAKLPNSTSLRSPPATSGGTPTANTTTASPGAPLFRNYTSLSPPSLAKQNATSHRSPPAPSAHPMSTTPAAPAVDATTASPGAPFFPNYPSISPPAAEAALSPPAGGNTIPTFPANISSLLLPHSHSSSHRSTTSRKLISVTAVLFLVAVSLIAAFLLLRRHRRDRTLHLSKHPPEQTPLPNNSEFHPIRTLATSNSTDLEPSRHENRFQSPEIRPLPPLHQQNHKKSDSGSTTTDSEEFYSPANSERIAFARSSSTKRASEEALARIKSLQIQSKISQFSSYPRSDSSSPGESARSCHSVLVDSASDSSNSCSPEYVMRPPSMIHCVTQPPPPPPPAMRRTPLTQPPVLPRPSRSFKSGEQERNSQGESWNRDRIERNCEFEKAKLKGLHWNTLRARSDVVTDFALDEERMETLCTTDRPRKPMMKNMSTNYRVLDPNKSQNIAILLRALNVTVEEVCDSILEGNADMLGTELLESLMKMAPNEEEERKLRQYKDESPLKLGLAEKFLKGVLDIPFVFKRVEAMLYMANFDSEVEHLRRSFKVLEVACDELRNNRMFLKLLEAVLETGNRINTVTNQGDAHAFKLDTLLALVDVKGTNGKTTLLHFVVQEMIKLEGHGKNASSSLQDDMEARKRGLQIISGLSGELTNVKKATAMDPNILAKDVNRLVQGIAIVEEVVRLNEIGLPNHSHRTRFGDSVIGFIKRANGEVVKIQELQKGSLSKVKELIEYFHGNSTKEEAHRLRIFMVVRDFLSILDNVCKEVAKVNERSMICLSQSCAMPVNPSLPRLFDDHGNGERRDEEEELLS